MPSRSESEPMILFDHFSLAPRLFLRFFCDFNVGEHEEILELPPLFLFAFLDGVRSSRRFSIPPANLSLNPPPSHSHFTVFVHADVPQKSQMFRLPLADVSTTAPHGGDPFLLPIQFFFLPVTFPDA